MITSKSNPETIQKMFGAIASNYDFANSILSFNLHKSWNKQLVARARLHNPECLLDLCAGTGEIAFLWLQKQPQKKKAILLDFCPEMLDVARRRITEGSPTEHDLTFLQADAQSIPLPDESVECVTIAYGIRNVQDPASCFKEALRVLKPGGTFTILELTEPKNRFIKFGHQLYLNYFLPVMGGWLTRKPEAYRYLSTSIQAFVKPEVLEQHLKEAGFTILERTPLTLGIAHLLSAKK